MVMDSTVESAVTPMTPSQDGVVVKKKKKRRRSTAAKELPPLQMPPTTSLELYQLSGMKRGKVPPLIIENSQAVKEESVSQESDGGNTQQRSTITRVTLPGHLSNDVPRSKLDRVTTASSTPDPDATITANLMSKFEHVVTDTLLESGRSLVSDKLNSTGSHDSQLSQARLRRRDSRRGKLTASQLLTDWSTVEQTPALEIRPLPAGPLVTPQDGDRTGEEAETLFNTEQSTEADTLHDSNRNIIDDAVNDTVNDTDILGITVHSTDCLLPDVNLLHPLVQVHVVDMATGGYIKKSDRLRNAVSYYETGNTNVDFIIPLQTQPAHYPNGIHRDLSVTWDEHLVINERLSHFTNNPNTILFFELLDFSNSMEAQSDRRSCDPGWYRVAWAFLKLVSSHGNPNTYKKCRLQLYRYPHTKRRRKIIPQEERIGIEIYHIWSSLKRIVYPSTIYVTIKGVCPPSTAFAVQRSMLPQQPEEANVTYEQLLMKSHQSKKDVTKLSRDSIATRIWKRLPGQTCQLPNQLVHTLGAGKIGCTALAFSHSGCQLAVCCYDNTRECAVKVYSVPDCQDHVRLTGHHGIIYHAHWSPDDDHLLTASQDTTVRHWDLSSSHAHHMVLPHPCFVYDAIYHTSLDHVILTAGYDKLVYIWTVRSTESRYGQCLHKMSGHDGYINCLCLNMNVLYSADHTGVFCKWMCPASHDAILSWKLYRLVSLAELKDHVITSLELQPTNHNRLLICTQDGRVFLIDTNVLHVVRHYHNNSSVQINQSVAVFSACGTYVLLGVGHYLTVCRANSGVVVGQYHTLPLHHPFTCLLFHPMDHIIALSAFGTSEPVLVYSYNKEVEGGVVDLLEVPVVEETTPLPSSHDVMAQSTRLQKAVYRLGLVTQQSGAGSGIVSELESTYPSSVTTVPPKLTTTTSHPPPLHVPFSSAPNLHSSTAPQKAVVLFDYTAQQPNELSVQQGTCVTILSNEDPHWWRGQINNQEGYIPASYVAIEDTSPAASLKEKKFHSQEDPELHKSAVSVRGKKKVKHKLP